MVSGGPLGCGFRENYWVVALEDRQVVVLEKSNTFLHCNGLSDGDIRIDQGNIWVVVICHGQCECQTTKSDNLCLP